MSDAGRRWTAAGLVLGLGVAVVLAAGDRGASDGLGLAEAVVLGAVEGVTEWLPISSTGHLVVTQELLGIRGAFAASYAIAIQAGAILAVLSLYPARIRSMVAGVLGRDPNGGRLALAVIVAAAPAAVVGLAFEEQIKRHLFGVWPVVVAWVVGGVAILLVVRWRRGRPPTHGLTVDAIRWTHAVAIGAAQVLALWPGVSRSLVTILAATTIGLSVPAAVEFSFLLGFVVLSGATVYEAASSGQGLVAAYGIASPLLGLAVAFVTSYLSMRWMVAYVTRRGLAVFGWYRIGIGVVVAGLLLTGVL